MMLPSRDSTRLGHHHHLEKFPFTHTQAQIQETRHSEPLVQLELRFSPSATTKHLLPPDYGSTPPSCCEQYTLLFPRAHPEAFRLASLGLLDMYIADRNQRLHTAIAATVGIPPTNTFRLSLVTGSQDIPVSVNVLVEELDRLRQLNAGAAISTLTLTVRISDGVPVNIRWCLVDQQQREPMDMQMVAKCPASGLGVRTWIQNAVLGMRIQGMTSRRGGESPRGIINGIVRRIFCVGISLGARDVTDDDVIMSGVTLLDAGATVDVVWDQDGEEGIIAGQAENERE